MSNVALSMEHVYKKFRKGEVFNSLRDLMPALTGKMFRQLQLSEGDKREFWALRDVSFEVERGEAFGIVGSNGAGKSTMLKVLCRVMKPTRGSIQVFGRVSALIELSAGFHQDLTGRENIYLYGSILGMTRQEVRSKMDEMIAFSGLEEFIDTPVKRYSSGMYARLGFSVAAHVNTEVLLVDEVLSVGDYAFQNRCVERMKEVIRNGATVLFVSHNLKTVAEFCNRCLLLERGQAVLTASSEEIITAYINRNQAAHQEGAGSRAVTISRVRVRNAAGDSTRFHSGEKAWIDVELHGHARASRLSLSLYITTEEHQSIFSTSTERLGLPTFSLDDGDVYNCTFELTLNMVKGIYYPGVLVFRYDTETEFDRWAPAATIYVNSEDDVRGAVHCFPKVIRQEIRSAADALVSVTAGEARLE